MVAKHILNIRIGAGENLMNIFKSFESTYQINLCYLPRTDRDYRRLFHDGKYSFKNCLPKPKMKLQGIEDLCHAYALPSDCLKHAFASGTDIFNLMEISTNTKCDHILNSLDAQQILEQSEKINTKTTDFVGSFSTFSDDWSPFSHVTASEGSKGIWSYHMQFLCKKGNVTEFGDTYLLAIGKKGVNHNNVLKIIYEDLQSLGSSNNKNCFFSSSKKQVLNTLFFPLIMHGDQLERREINGTMAGNSAFHKRWKWSFHFGKKSKCLVSCEDCSKRIQAAYNTGEYSTELLKCKKKKCTNWSMDPSNTMLHYEPNDKFPKDILPEHNLLTPFQITHQSLTESCNLAYQKYLIADWNKSNVEEYLSYHCVRTYIISDIISNANRSKSISIILGNIDRSDTQSITELLQACKNEDENVLISYFLESPDDFKMPILPYIWTTNMKIQIFHDAPMHLLSGLTKTVINQAHMGIKKLNKTESLSNLFNTSIIKDLKDIHCDWHTTTIYKTEKMVGFNSAQKIGLGK